MKKSLLSSLIVASIAFSAVSFATANSYDDLVNDLANSILTQIQNDIEPVETTDNLDITIDEAMNTMLTSMFLKSDSSYTLTAKSLNNRLNGGIIAKDLKDAVNYLYNEKLTKYSTPETFQANNSLRRDEAAKFFSLFASEVMKKQEDSSKSCSFSDLNEGHTDLQTNVVSSCKLGIFKGKDGMFNPTASLTNGEALTVLIRILSGNMDETAADHWAKAYWQKAQTYGLTQGTLMDSMHYLDKPITRGDVARLLEGARIVAAIKTTLKSDVSYSLNSHGFVTVK